MNARKHSTTHRIPRGSGGASAVAKKAMRVRKRKDALSLTVEEKAGRKAPKIRSEKLNEAAEPSRPRKNEKRSHQIRKEASGMFLRLKKETAADDVLNAQRR